MIPDREEHTIWIRMNTTVEIPHGTNILPDDEGSTVPICQSGWIFVQRGSWTLRSTQTRWERTRMNTHEMACYRCCSWLRDPVWPQTISTQSMLRLAPSKLSKLRGWWNTVEIVILLEISNSMKPYPSALRAYTDRSRPLISLSEPRNDEICPTVFRQPPRGKDAGLRSPNTEITTYN